MKILIVFMVAIFLTGCSQENAESSASSASAGTATNNDLSARQRNASMLEETSPAPNSQPATNQILNNVTTDLQTTNLAEFPEEKNPAANVVRGQIISVDLPQNQITFKDASTGNELTVRVADPSNLGELKADDFVKVTFASSQTNTALNVVKE